MKQQPTQRRLSRVRSVLGYWLRVVIALLRRGCHTIMKYFSSSVAGGADEDPAIHSLRLRLEPCLADFRQHALAYRLNIGAAVRRLSQQSRAALRAQYGEVLGRPVVRFEEVMSATDYSVIAAYVMQLLDERNWPYDSTRPAIGQLEDAMLDEAERNAVKILDGITLSTS